MLDEIKEKYRLVKKKTEFIQLVAEKLNRGGLYLRNNWFSSFWSIPTSEQQKVLDILNETIKNQ